MSQFCLLVCGTTATNSKFVIMDSGVRVGQLHTGFKNLYKSLSEYEILVSAVHPLFCSSSNSLWVMSAPPPPPQAALQVARHKWPTLRPTIRYRALSNSVFLCCVFLCISLSLSGTDPRLGKLLEIAARALRPLRRALIHL